MNLTDKIIRITDLAAPELDVYARLTEAQLLRYFEPQPGLFIAESPNVILRALEGGYEPVSFLAEEEQITGEAGEVLEKCPGVPVYTAEEEVLRQLRGYPMTRGALCAMRRPPLPSMEEICGSASRIAVLENVVNPTNVGAIFRSAAALGMDGVLLTADCSNPLYRRASRVSMGTVFQIPWTYIDRNTVGEAFGYSRPDTNHPYIPRQDNTKCIWPESGMEFLHDAGFTLAAMALSDDSIPISDPALKKADKLAIVLGSEGPGLLPQTIAACDYVVKIPMSRGVDSLNVAAASAVVFWELQK